MLEPSMNNRTQLTPSTAAERGFTLVEVMVVIVILGILATIVARNVIGQSEVARVELCKSKVLDLQSAVDMYRLRNHKPPDDWNQLIEKDSTGEAYLKITEPPLDPWDRELILKRGEFPNQVFVVSLGPDGQEGTEDDISSETAGNRKPR